MIVAKRRAERKAAVGGGGRRWPMVVRGGPRWSVAARGVAREDPDMTVRPILLLGDPRLYEASTPVRRAELDALRPVIDDLHDTMAAFQAEHGWGRAIAAPQLGICRRIVCMNVEAPITMLNPVLDLFSDEQAEFWEDCMSFPELLVRLSNPRRCRLTYRDIEWGEHRVALSDDFAELLQHEVDHLDGVLAVQRAIDDRSIVLRRARPAKELALRGEFRRLPAEG
jgi:peptide deformylase